MTFVYVRSVRFIIVIISLSQFRVGAVAKAKSSTRYQTSIKRFSVCQLVSSYYIDIPNFTMLFFCLSLTYFFLSLSISSFLSSFFCNIFQNKIFFFIIFVFLSLIVHLLPLIYLPISYLTLFPYYPFLLTSLPSFLFFFSACPFLMICLPPLKPFYSFFFFTFHLSTFSHLRVFHSYPSSFSLVFQ